MTQSMAINLELLQLYWLLNHTTCVVVRIKPEKTGTINGPKKKTFIRDRGKEVRDKLNPYRLGRHKATESLHSPMPEENLCTLNCVLNLVLDQGMSITKKLELSWLSLL